MLQALQQWVTAVLGYLSTYPEIVALTLATAFSWGAALWAERVVFNPDLSLRQQQRASTTVTSVTCLVFALVLWPVFDHDKDPRLMRIGISLGAAIWSPFLYILLTRWLGVRWPWLK